ncbi:GNAT family N-acetyltransferase [Glycomyces tenuis]|uniref:GNAT family N-acetyltransferase n=2 Tax=Glycomyces tenuis TaxID=58116 RepID=UPI000478BFB3|nr:GNAT family N-acetyltransferase [Glycomyces tenuis]
MNDRITADGAAWPRFEAAVEDFWSLGGEVSAHDGYELVRHRAAPDHPLGNFCRGLRTAAAAESIRAHGDDAAAPLPPRVIIDTEAPPAVEAVLALNDWALERLLVLELAADVPVPEPHGLQVRHADGEEDWREIERLFRIDHLEEDARHGSPPRPPELTRSAVALRRALGPQVRYLLAEGDRSVVATIAVWVGGEGIGLIEDVFVHPRERGSGVATQMLRRAVAHARGRGAGSVLIGAEIDDTPKHLYHRFGFRPVGVQHSYHRPTP